VAVVADRAKIERWLARERELAKRRVSRLREPNLAQGKPSHLLTVSQRPVNARNPRRGAR